MALSEITNYLEDDWDDNNLTGRASTTEGYFLHPSDGLISDMEAGDALKGVYRPEWTTQSGSPSATNQELQLADGSTTVQAVSIPSVFTVGRWQWDHDYNSNPSSGGTRLYFIAQNSGADPNDAYAIEVLHDTNLDLIKDSGGSESTLINGSRTDNTSSQNYDVARDSYGGFELFNDGDVSQGTATDTTHTESLYLVIRNSANARSDNDNVVVK